MTTMQKLRLAVLAVLLISAGAGWWYTKQPSPTTLPAA